MLRERGYVALMARILKGLEAKGINYNHVKRVADVSWSMVFKVANRQRRSAHVLATMGRLAGVAVPKRYL